MNAASTAPATPSPDLVRVSCYHCGSDRFEAFDRENGYELVKCEGCGLLLVNPRPAEESISRAKLTGVHEGERTVATTGRYARRRVRRYLAILDEFYPDGELARGSCAWLDVGCGFGELIEALARHSAGAVDALGTELNEFKVASARARGLNVGMHDLDELDRAFDTISLLNVWSHLPDPVRFIEGLKPSLGPGGELFLQTGDTCHLGPEDQHAPYYLPDHLSFANRDIVESVLDGIGFDTVHARVYRSPMYPRWTNLEETAIEFAKIALRRNGSLRNFFPRYPDKDLFIRARLRS